uniref:Peptidase A2 domain-containing protein n=1 Tax=Solanum tuberosum TaxID=4113 RepID=M1BXD6_SOLTU
MVRQAVEILGRRLNVADGKFKTLKDFTLEQTDNLRKELESYHQAPEKPKEYGTQYIGITINVKPARAMVDTGAEANLMTKTAATRLGPSYSPSNAQLRTVNGQLTPMCRVSHGVSITLGEWQDFATKRMAIEGDVNAASTTNFKLDGGKKTHKGKKHQKSNEEMLLDPTPSEALTYHPPSTTKASDDELGEEAIDVTAGEGWIARVEMARQAVDILGRHLNVADGKFKTPEDFTLEETYNLRKELEVRQCAEFEMKEAITFLECRLIEALSTIETMKAE